MNRYRNGSGFLYGRGCFALNCPNTNSTNVSLPDDFDKILSVMRSRGVSVSIILQNLAQLKALFEKQWESIVGNCDELVYLGGNEQSTHKYISEQLGKATIDTNTYGRSDGLRGNFSTNFQLSGRELMTPDEVRMLDNKYCIAFIRGERPVLDYKYDILKHPNVGLSKDGGAPVYVHGFGELEGNPWAHGVSKEVYDITKEVETMYAGRQSGEVIVLDEFEFAMHLEKIKKDSEKEKKE